MLQEFTTSSRKSCALKYRRGLVFAAVGKGFGLAKMRKANYVEGESFELNLEMVSKSCSILNRKEG